MIKLEPIPRSFWVSCQEGASYMALERTRLQHKNATATVMVLAAAVAVIPAGQRLKKAANNGEGGN